VAKFLLVVVREGIPLPEERIRRACALLMPDNIQPLPPELRTRPGLALAIVSPTPVLPVHETSVCLGQMFRPHDPWWVPGSGLPDGSFALVRTDDASVELATDAVASRSIFFAATDGLFVASSSQRAIVAVLGGFRLNTQSVSWMLSAGALGLGLSWDERISRLGADSRVLLDRRTWKVTRSQQPITFRPEPRPEKEHAARLKETLLSVCDGLDLGDGVWRLPLSGGHDSRFLLLTLSGRHRLPCVTWGVQSSLDEAGNDAYVAKCLARKLGVPHEFFPMDLSTEPAEVLFDRFLANGDGCVDHISAYLDGFEVWRRLHAQGVFGIVRGDEGFGWERVLVQPAVRWSVGAVLLRDFFSSKLIGALELADQVWPTELERARGESLATWRDRLYHAFRIPTFLASLTDLKMPYVEVVNPLLSRRVLERVRAMPDTLRTEKRLFKRLVESMSPPIPFASRDAIPDLQLVVGGGAFMALARQEVLAGRDAGSLPGPFADYLLARLPAPDSPSSTANGERGPWARERYFSFLRRVVPQPVQRSLRACSPRPPSCGSLAFRAAIVSRMAKAMARAGAGA
jgi:hypothetical protein